MRKKVLLFNQRFLFIKNMRLTVKSLLILLMFSFAAWQSTSHANNRIKLPDIGSSSGIIISTQIEKKLGKLFIRSIRRSIPLIEDPEINEYIQTLGNRVAKASEQPDRYFNFFWFSWLCICLYHVFKTSNPAKYSYWRDKRRDTAFTRLDSGGWLWF